MGEQNKSDLWGLCLSLRPPIFDLDNEKAICKRGPHFSADEKSPKMHKPNTQLVIDLEEIETSKLVCSPNSTLSSSATTAKRFGGFREDRDIISDDEEGGGDGGGGCGGDGGGGERKKLRLSKEQIMVLENTFREHTSLNTRQKVTLARQVNLRPRQVEVWFQNRRARTKLKQTEVDCEYLRRFCETLTEQNRKLQKEVQELRALKVVSPDQSVVPGKKNHLGTAFNMCPSCKTVSLSSSSATRPTTSKSPTSEAGCYQAGVLHRPVPLNLQKLSLTINNNRMFESHLSRA